MAFLQNTAGCIFCGNPPAAPSVHLTPSPSSPHSSLCRSLPLSRLRCRRRRRRRSHLTPLHALAALPCVPHPVAPVPGNGVLSQRPPRHLAGGGRAPRSRLGTSKVDARRRVLESVDDRVGGVVRADDVLHGDSHFLPHGRAVLRDSLPRKAGIGEARSSTLRSAPPLPDGRLPLLPCPANTARSLSQAPRGPSPGRAGADRPRP